MDFAGITFDELVQYVKLKKKIKMCSGSRLDDYVVGPGKKRQEVLKIGDVIKQSDGSFYVVVDIQLEHGQIGTGFGVEVKIKNGVPYISDGATYFRSDSNIDRKLDFDVTELSRKHLNATKLTEIEKLEKQIEKLKSELI